MVLVGYHASHEQHRPSELLRYVRHAESAGFAGAWSSDHLTPWSRAQGESGFAWAWLGDGTRRRLPPMLDGDERRLRRAYSLVFSLPGTPVLF